MDKEKNKELNTKILFQKRSSSQKVHVIINPSSAGGKTRMRQEQLLKIFDRNFGKNYSLCVTQKPLDAIFSAKRAIIEGSEVIIAIGGDGTIQEAVNGFFSNGSPINPACQLGVINSGTGSGFSQSLGLPQTINEQLEAILSGQSRFVDVGRAFFSDIYGRPKERYFLNECQAGIGGEVVKNVSSKLKKMGGRLSFGLSSLSMVFRYHSPLVTAVIDGTHRITNRLISIVMANGHLMAGGMKLTPHAKVDDGLFDILLIHEQDILQRLWNFPKIYFGRHIASSKFSYFQGKSISITSNEKVLFEADGELLGWLPSTVEILPSALKVRFNFSGKDKT